MFNIALVGNPNTGKTTLFNTLTKSNEKASNWHGVTVDVKSKKYKFNECEFCVYDTPGVYLLDGAVAEEKTTKEWLTSNKCDLIVNICDANNFKRNFALTEELLKLSVNVIVAVNMSAECCLYDYKALSRELNCLIIEIDARKQSSVKHLKTAIFDILHNKKPQNIVKTNKKHISIDNFILKNTKSNPYKVNDKIDSIVLNKIVFISLFILALVFIFYTVFNGLGMVISNITNAIFNKIIQKMQKIILCVNINNITKSLLFDAILGSFATVVSFLPQVLLLMFFINLLEDIGFMSRVAFMLDGPMKKIGLSGKSLFSIFMGYGCTTSAVISSRNLQDDKIRKRTILLLPYSSCSAKLPIFLLLSSLFFKRYKFLFVLGLYLFSIIVQIIYAVILNKIRKIESSICLFEMPKYRLPNFKKIFLDSFKVFKEFIFKIGSLLLIFGVLVWLLQNFDLKFNFLNGKKFSSSILYRFANVITPFFKPVGLDNPAIISALFFGLIAKEFLLVGLAMMNGVIGDISFLGASLITKASVCYFTPISSIVFLVFVLLYSPCFSCLSSIASEVDLKTAVFVFVTQFLIAYLAAFIVKQALENLKAFLFALIIIILAIILLTMLKSKCKSNCKGNCDACRNT